MTKKKEKKPVKKAVETKKEAPAVQEQAEKVPPPPDTVPDTADFNELLSKLPEKHARFVEEYLIDLNETKAAIRAGGNDNRKLTICDNRILTTPEHS